MAYFSCCFVTERAITIAVDQILRIATTIDYFNCYRTQRITAVVFRNYFDYCQIHQNYYLVIVVIVKYQINHNFAIGYFTTTIHTVIIGIISFISFIVVVGHSPDFLPFDFDFDLHILDFIESLSRSYSIRTLIQMDYPDSIMVPQFQTGHHRPCRTCLGLVRSPWASLVL